MIGEKTVELQQKRLLEAKKIMMTVVKKSKKLNFRKISTKIGLENSMFLYLRKCSEKLSWDHASTAEKSKLSNCFQFLKKIKRAVKKKSKKSAFEHVLTKRI